MEQQEYYVLSRDSRGGETALPKFDFVDSQGQYLFTHREALSEVARLESRGHICAVIPQKVLERVLKRTL